MDLTSPLIAHPAFNAFLVVLVSSLCYFFTNLYKARMLFLRRKHMGLVRKDRSRCLFLRWLTYVVPQPCAPRHSFIFGHLLYLKGLNDGLPPNAHEQYMFADIAHEHFQDRGMFYVDLWPVSGMMIIVTSPLVATQVAQTNTRLSHDRAPILKRFFKPIAGGPNLFDMSEKEWRPWRQIFNKGFSTEQNTNIVPHVLEETEVYKQTLRALAEKDEVFYLDLVTLRFTMDMIGQTILNTSLKAQEGYNVLADSMLSQIRWHQPNSEVNPFGHFNFVRWTVEWWNGRRMDQYIGREVDKRFVEVRSSSSSKKHKSVIDLVLQAYVALPGKPIPEKLDPDFRTFAIRQIRLFLFTGHDSTSSTICYAFHLLSKNPDALKQIRAEHDEVLGKDLSRASALLKESPKLLNNLPYTTAVIKEALRLFPPAASSRDGKPGISICDDQGTACSTEDVSMIWTLHVELHRHPKYWKRPLEFLPERWLVDPGHELFPTKHAYRAFEYGPRNCIAEGIVMTELKIILASMVREFDFKDAYEEWDQRHPARDKDKLIYRGDRAYQMEEAAAHPVEHYPCRVSLRGE
ncbi:MAG: hypothetical protein Q9208_007732 [Pyrenodesmia sp. 3 TL-2023]